MMVGGCAAAQDHPAYDTPYDYRLAGTNAVSDRPIKIGKPYVVKGVTYVPADDRDYDEVGLADWYGPESGGRTASGEAFRPDGITAAHTTLPMPSYVEVTALDTGRTILVRINDRGPFTTGRIIDLSRGAAKLLGLRHSSPVRVLRVDPSEDDKERLRAGEPAGERRPASAADLANLRERYDEER
jgi:rare lipoprotein A